MDMYAENNGFQVLEGMAPFDDGSQVQGAGGFETETYQETAAEAVWYGDADGAGNLPVGQYQEPVAENVWYGGTGGEENLPAGQYQETAAEYEPAVYMEDADALPVEPGQMPVQETEGPGMYQDMAPEIGETVLMQADMPSMEGAISDAVQETAELEMEELKMEEPESTDSEMKEPETPEAGSPAAETATAPDDEETGCTEHETAPDTDGEDDEETERARHEAAEAERKAEWEARQQAKKDALKKQQEELAGMGVKIGSVYEAAGSDGALQGYVVESVSTEGYGGNIVLYLGVTLDGTLNDISILEISETAGLGMLAPEELVPQFHQKNVDSFVYTKTGAAAENEIDAMAGATITTKAVTNAVNGGLKAANALMGGGQNE